TDGLADLDLFKYIYAIFYIDRLHDDVSMKITPSWAPDIKVGLFASRSPNRPNPIGISIVKIKKIVNNEIFTSGLDVFDKTPLLDIKPYIKDLDSKDDANQGWVDGLENNKEHMSLHIKGIPHDY
ncbi:MAG: SAM-dependent methyltransferase, partial [Desulfobacteraceae bacterium]|nr:SAM-dependent methyltransferase [Desulfobacteraceae bacterium]